MPTRRHAQRRQPDQQLPVVKTLWPPQPGTKGLQREYGAALLCVRYRRDKKSLTRYTTVELVVSQMPLAGQHFDRKLFDVRVDWHEDALRASVKATGGQWNASRKVWQLPGKAIARLKLAQRVVGPSPRSRPSPKPR